MRSRRFLTSPQFPIPLHTPKRSCSHKAYYLTCDQYDTMRWRAGDRCEICRVRAEDVQKRRLYIDHDNRLGNGMNHVRGLVCAKCNAQLRFVDVGYRRPTPAQQRYLDMSWFYELLPPERQGMPWLPPPVDHPRGWTNVSFEDWRRLQREARDGRLARLAGRQAA